MFFRYASAEKNWSNRVLELWSNGEKLHYSNSSTLFDWEAVALPTLFVGLSHKSPSLKHKLLPITGRNLLMVENAVSDIPK